MKKARKVFDFVAYAVGCVVIAIYTFRAMLFIVEAGRKYFLGY